MKGIQVYSNEGPSTVQRENNHKSAKIGWDHLKYFLTNHMTRKAQIYMKAS
jgi:hypothetical protein